MCWCLMAFLFILEHSNQVNTIQLKENTYSMYLSHMPHKNIEKHNIWPIENLVS